MAKTGLHINCEWNEFPQHSWWKGGLLHRVEGPAHMLPSPSFEESVKLGVWYWYEGQRLGCDGAGFWALWDIISPEERESLELHCWMSRHWNSQN